MRMVYAIMVDDLVAAYFYKDIVDSNKIFLEASIKRDLRDYGATLAELPEKAANILHEKYVKLEKKRKKDERNNHRTESTAEPGIVASAGSDRVDSQERNNADGSPDDKDKTRSKLSNK